MPRGDDVGAGSADLLSAERFQVILSSISDGVFTVDREGRIACFNRAAEKITGYTRDEVLGRLREELRFDSVAYGLNADDRHDFRPGHRAAEEHHVLAPLMDVALSKAEIRALSRAAGLPTADLPASACLASRLPYGMEVTPERLRQVEEGEQRLRDLGFRQVRLRHHAELARVEIDPSELPEALDPAMAEAIVAAIKPLGFRFVSLDLEGYRTGALNEVLWTDRKRGE